MLYINFEIKQVLKPKETMILVQTFAQFDSFILKFYS